MSRLLEKPFDLQDLHEAVDGALAGCKAGEGLGPPIAALTVGIAGELEFTSQRATEILAAAGISLEVTHLDEVVAGDSLELLAASEEDWVEVRPRSDSGEGWLMRARRRAGQTGWLAVFWPLEEEQRRSEPRVRMMCEMR